jgi:hypothetical protein
MSDYPIRITAVFAPTKTDNLRPGLEKFIGQRFTFYRSFEQDEGPYAGQQTWIFDRCHDDELGDENAVRWVPEEDLQEIEAA